MLTYKQAKKVGRNACINRLGRDFVLKHRKSAGASFMDCDSYVQCFVGVNEKEMPKTGKIVLDDSRKDFDWSAECNVSYADGKIVFGKCKLPIASQLSC